MPSQVHLTKVCILAAVLMTSASCTDGGQGSLSADELAGAAYKVGDKVKAPFGKSPKMKSGEIMEVYGKLAKIRFTDRKIGWALVKAVDPPGAIQRYPEGDKCAYGVDDKVRAPWSNRNVLYGGVIDEVHGKVAHIQYDDGDHDWIKCERLKPPSSTKSGGGGARSGGGDTAAIRKCRQGCNRACRSAPNGSKCVGDCRRACKRR